MGMELEDNRAITNEKGMKLMMTQNGWEKLTFFFYLICYRQM